MIKDRENAGIRHVNNPIVFIVCLNTIDDVYEDINNYNPKKDKKKSLNCLWWHDGRYYEK